LNILVSKNANISNTTPRCLLYLRIDLIESLHIQKVAMSLPFFICRSDKRYVAILFFAVFMILSLVGKSQSFEADSLKLNQQEVFTPNKASLYLILSQEFINVNLDSAVYYGEKGLSCALDAKLDEIIIIEHLRF